MNQDIPDIDETLLLKFLLGQASETEMAAVAAWLDGDPAHRDLLDSLESLWLETGRLVPAPVAVDVDRAWNRMEMRMASDADRHDGIRRLRTSRAAWAAAASVLLIAGLFALYELTRPAPRVHLASAEQVRTDTLPDGSAVTLNRHSSLDFPAGFTGRVREVILVGDAFFRVKHDPKQPFVVDAGPAKIRVLGTSFRVSTRPGRVVEVAVAEGRVMLFRVDERTGDTLSLDLTAGQRGVMKHGSPVPADMDTVSPDGLFWANRSFDFRGTPLSRVFSLLQQHYPVKIAVGNPGILDCRLTATFVNEPAGKIIKIISESFGLKLESEGENYRLSGDGCKAVH
jgi:ferric-dicitrate binding protein FerR (iron transport regulator)